MPYETYTVADVKQKSSEELFDVISCFAGGGGSSTGIDLQVVKFYSSMNL